MAQAEAYACAHSQIEEALRFAMEKIDRDSRLYKTISKVFELYDAGVGDGQAQMSWLLTEQRRSNFTDCVMNLSFVVHALFAWRGVFKDGADRHILWTGHRLYRRQLRRLSGIAKGQAAFPRAGFERSTTGLH